MRRLHWDWRNGLVLLAACLLALVVWIILDAGNARREAVKTAIVSAEAAESSRDRATRRIDLLQKDISTLTEQVKASTEAQARATAQVDTLAEQVKQLGGQPIFTGGSNGTAPGNGNELSAGGAASGISSNGGGVSGSDQWDRGKLALGGAPGSGAGGAPALRGDQPGNGQTAEGTRRDSADPTARVATTLRLLVPENQVNELAPSELSPEDQPTGGGSTFALEMTAHCTPASDDPATAEPQILECALAPKGTNEEDSMAETPETETVQDTPLVSEQTETETPAEQTGGEPEVSEDTTDGEGGTASENDEANPTPDNTAKDE